MSTLRTIKSVVPARRVNMGGHLLDQPLPVEGLDYHDPFLLIHHWESTLPGGQRPNEVGVGPHPHRGFSPVTFVFKGSVEHRDSLGNRAVVEGGGTQWMFAGRGITHSERQSKELVEQGGDLEIIQFWVNAPAAKKMEPAFYKPISLDETPLIEKPGSRLWVVSGQLGDKTGVAPTFTPQLLLRGEISQGSHERIDIPESHNALIYLLDGELEVDGRKLFLKDMGVLNNDGQAVEIKANEDTRYIILAGEPINEPVMSYGPFVMTNETEILEALRDAQMGKMGILIEEFD